MRKPCRNRYMANLLAFALNVDQTGRENVIGPKLADLGHPEPSIAPEQQPRGVALPSGLQ